MGTQHFRQEAKPLRLAELDPAQNDAARAIVALIASCIRQDDKGNAHETSARRFQLPDGIATRKSRVIFLSGARGTGKTTVLMTLLAATDAKPEDVHAKGCQGKCENRENPPSKESCIATRDDWNLVVEHAIWLDPLDMERMPPSANLLAAILVRIREAMDRALGPRSDFGSPRRFAMGASPQADTDPHEMLESLQRDVAMAWDPTDIGPRRASAGQSDAHAVEVLEAERGRLGFNARLERTVRLYVDRVKALHRLAHRPVLVLPVDDFDLNPTRCLELLRFLRMVSVPHLLTVVLGCIELTESALAIDQVGEFARLATEGLRDREFRHLIDRTAAETAAQAIRKLLPPGQVLEIEHAPLENALKYSPAGSLVTLDTLLQGVPISLPSAGISPRKEGGTSEMNVSKMIKPDEPSKSAGTTPAQPFDYIGRHAFELPWRHVVDLHACLTNRLERQGKQGQFRFFEDLADRAVAEDLHLSIAQKVQLRTAIHRLDKLKWHSSLWPVEFDYSDGRHRYFPPTGTGDDGAIKPAVIAVREWDWRTTLQYREAVGGHDPSSFEASRSGSESKILWSTFVSPRTVGALTLLRDAVSEGYGGTGPRLNPWRHPLIWTEWGSVRIPWLFHRWSTFYEYEYFLYLWKKEVDASESDVASLAKAWRELPFKVLEKVNPGITTMKMDDAKSHPVLMEFLTHYRVATECLRMPEAACGPAAPATPATPATPRKKVKDPKGSVFEWATKPELHNDDTFKADIDRRVQKVRTHFLERFYEAGSDETTALEVMGYPTPPPDYVKQAWASFGRQHPRQGTTAVAPPESPTSAPKT